MNRGKQTTSIASLCTALAVTGGLASQPSLAETRGYIISWFATATYVPDAPANKIGCPQGRNGHRLELDIRNLESIGLTEAQALEAIKKYGVLDIDDSPLGKQILMSAVLPNGQHEPIYNYPDATKDPNIETVSGKYAYGFDLGGTNAANKFEDPDTHSKVDDQLWRAVGCLVSFAVPAPSKPYPEEVSWNLEIDSAPAWTLQISGKDLRKDGPVTITLDQATTHPERDAHGLVLADTTYVVEPHSKSHNVLEGEIKDGVLTITPADIYLHAELPFYPEIALRSAHMRFEALPEGKLVAYWGGYLDWRRFAYMYTSRPGNNADEIGIYHALKDMADFDPDPVTGQNRYISGTFRMEATPAYVAQQNGKVLAVPVHDAGALRQVEEPGSKLQQ